jgi:hypothetical protein
MLAVGLTLFGSAFLAVSFMSADVSDVLKSPDGTKHAPPLRSRWLVRKNICRRAVGTPMRYFRSAMGPFSATHEAQ